MSTTFTRILDAPGSELAHARKRAVGSGRALPEPHAELAA
jgi:hypothetical protein